MKEKNKNVKYKLQQPIEVTVTHTKATMEHTDLGASPHYRTRYSNDILTPGQHVR